MGEFGAFGPGIRTDMVDGALHRPSAFDANAGRGCAALSAADHEVQDAAERPGRLNA